MGGLAQRVAIDRRRPLGLSVAGRAGRHAPEYALAAPLTGQDGLAERSEFELPVPFPIHPDEQW